MSLLDTISSKRSLTFQLSLIWKVLLWWTRLTAPEGEDIYRHTILPFIIKLKSRMSSGTTSGPRRRRRRRETWQFGFSAFVSHLHKPGPFFPFPHSLCPKMIPDFQFIFMRKTIYLYDDQHLPPPAFSSSFTSRVAFPAESS